MFEIMEIEKGPVLFILRTLKFWSNLKKKSNQLQMRMENQSPLVVHTDGESIRNIFDDDLYLIDAFDKWFNTYESIIYRYQY
jgi:hypothetical protein